MAKFIKAYYYLFYKFYQVAKTGAIKSLSHWYAQIAMMALEIWFAFSLYNYYTMFINRHATLEIRSFKVIFFIIALLALNYFSFDYKEKWKARIAEFDQWSKKKNMIGGIIAWSFILMIVANLIFSYYLMSQISWSQYR